MSTNYVAKNIEFLCQKCGISVRQLAMEVEMSPSAMYRLVNPENAIAPRARTIKNVANFFRVDPVLLRDTDLSVYAGRIPIADREQASVFGSISAALKNSSEEKDEEEEDTNEPNVAERDKEKAPEGYEPKELEEKAFEKSGKQPVLIPLVAITNPSRFNPEDFFMFVTDYSEDAETQKVFGFKVLDWITAPYGIHGSNLTAYSVQGDAMWPEVKSGDIAYIVEFDETIFESKSPKVSSGDVVLAKGILDGKSAILLRKAIKNENGDIYLVASNPGFAGPAVKAEAVYGRVVGLSRHL